MQAFKIWSRFGFKIVNFCGFNQAANEAKLTKNYFISIRQLFEQDRRFCPPLNSLNVDCKLQLHQTKACHTHNKHNMKTGELVVIYLGTRYYNNNTRQQYIHLMRGRHTTNQL